MFGPVVRWHLDETAPQGVGRSEAASSKARAVLCSKSLSSTVPDMRSKISTGHYCPHGQYPLC
jgi:hypothetical protein